jgi:hypothetical protein
MPEKVLAQLERLAEVNAGGPRRIWPGEIRSRGLAVVFLIAAGDSNIVGSE